MSAIDIVIKESLEAFVEDIFAKSWWGKEREAVSLYAFGYLIKQCRATSVLYDPDFRLQCIRIQNKKKDPDWLRL
jgi:hypothetical protein